jgi:hypothetical protein
VAAARERLEKIDAKKKAAKALAGNLPPGMLEQIAQLFSEYIAANTGYEVEPALIIQGALPMEDLQAYQLDTETIETMLAASEVEAAKAFIAKQTMVNEAVAQNLQRHLSEETLPAQQREEAEIHSKLCASNAQLYDNLMKVLMGEINAPSELQMEEMELANQRLSENMAAKEAKLVHPDTGLSVNMHIQDVVMEQMRELTAEYLGIDVKELHEMNQDQLQQELAKAGVNVDVLEELRKLTEAEAGKVSEGHAVCDNRCVVIRCRPCLTRVALSSFSSNSTSQKRWRRTRPRVR